MADPGLVRQKVGGVVRRVAPSVRVADQRVRRAAFLTRLQVAAELAGARVDVDVADDLLVGRGVRIEFAPATANVLRIGRGSRIEDRVLLMLRGGSLLAGERVELRRDVVLKVEGRLRLDGDNPLSWGCVVHCSNDIHLERMAGLAEQVTLADSSHFFTTADTHFWHNVRTGSVRVGRNTWICPKATLVRGADVGAHCIVGAGSVVTGRIPDGSLASGAPAVARSLPLPWVEPSPEAPPYQAGA